MDLACPPGLYRADDGSCAGSYVPWSVAAGMIVGVHGLDDGRVLFLVSAKKGTRDGMRWLVLDPHDGRVVDAGSPFGKELGLPPWWPEPTILVAGTDPDASGRVMRLEVETLAWTPIDAPRPLLGEVGAVELRDGSWLFAGGAKDGHAVADAWLYDPRRDRWTELPPLGTPRDRPVMLPYGGGVDVCGGRDGEAPVDGCETWNGRRFTAIDRTWEWGSGQTLLATDLVQITTDRGTLIANGDRLEWADLPSDTNRDTVSWSEGIWIGGPGGGHLLTDGAFTATPAPAALADAHLWRLPDGTFVVERAGAPWFARPGEEPVELAIGEATRPVGHGELVLFGEDGGLVVDASGQVHAAPALPTDVPATADALAFADGEVVVVDPDFTLRATPRLFGWRVGEPAITERQAPVQSDARFVYPRGLVHGDELWLFDLAGGVHAWNHLTAVWRDAVGPGFTVAEVVTDGDSTFVVGKDASGQGHPVARLDGEAFVTLPPLPTPGDRQGLAVHEGALWAFGGRDAKGKPSSAVWRLGGDDVWHEEAPLAVPAIPAVTPLPNGRWLVVAEGAQLWDARRGGVVAPPPLERHFGTRLTPLGDGRVLISGGSKPIEIYEVRGAPVTGREVPNDAIVANTSDPDRRQAELDQARAICLAGDREACERLGLLFERFGDAAEAGRWRAVVGTPEAPPRDVAVGFDFVCEAAPDAPVSCYGLRTTATTEAPTTPLVRLEATARAICGLDATGRAHCWGGYPYVEEPLPPTDTFVDLAVTIGFACGLRGDGTAACWGSKVPYGAGEGTFDDLVGSQLGICGFRAGGSTCWLRDAAASLPSGTTQVGGAPVGACGLTALGHVACTGELAADPLGEAVFVELDMGPFGGCARDAAGGVQCFDINGRSPAPDDVFARLDVDAVGACGVRDDGSVRCWGSPFDVTCGTSPCVKRPGEAPYGDWWSPFDAVLAGPYRALELGYGYGCGVDESGIVACIGQDTTRRSEPPPTPVDAIAVSDAFACAIGRGGGITCWGDAPTPPEGEFARVEVGARGGVALDRKGRAVSFGALPGTLSADDRFLDVSVGANRVCGVRVDGSVACAGQGPPPPDGRFVEIDVAGASACARDLAGRLTCFGEALFGVPAEPVMEVDAHVGGYCALTTSGRALCFGGALGVLADREPDVEGLHGITASTLGACALDADDRPVCWGGTPWLTCRLAPGLCR